MFEKLKAGWAEARGAVLWKELSDLLPRVNAAQPRQQAKTCLALVGLLAGIDESVGRIDDMSEEGKKKLAGHLRKIGVEKHDFDVPRAHGYFLASLWLESGCLPGDDAARVHAFTSGIVDKAFDEAPALLEQYGAD